MAIKTVTVREGQSIFDLALQLYGDVSKVIDLCKLNPDTLPNVLVNNIAGLTINYEAQDNVTTNFYATNQITLSTKKPEFITGAAAFSVSFSPPFVPAPTI